jgi:hypothetical protein
MIPPYSVPYRSSCHCTKELQRIGAKQLNKPFVAKHYYLIGLEHQSLNLQLISRATATLSYTIKGNSYNRCLAFAYSLGH